MIDTYRPYSVLVALAAACVLATTPLYGAFHTWSFLGPVAAVVGVVFATVALAFTANRAAEGTALASLFAGVVVLFAGGPEALGGLTSGWRALLTVSVPAPAADEFLAVPMGIAAVAALGGVSALIATRAIGVALVAPTIGFVAAYAFGIGGNVPSWTAPAYTGAVLTVLAVGYAATTRVRYVVMTAITCLALVGGVFQLPSRTPADPRTAVRPDPDLLDTANPLTVIAAYQAAATADDPVFGLTASTPLAGSRVRFAVLDELGPNGWDTHEEFRRVGAELPIPENAAPTNAGDVHVDAIRYDSSFPWLPVVGTPRTASSNDGLFAASESGVLVSRGDEISYETRLTTPVADGAVAGAGVSPEALTYAACPADLVPGVAEIGRELAVQAPTPAPYDIARTVVGFVKQYRGYDTSAPGFQTPAVLDGEVRALSPQNPYGQWNVEAYVASVTTLLRCAGVPARIAIGAVLPSDTGERVDIARGDLTAWSEILLSGYGWQPIDPLPAASEEANAIEMLRAVASGETTTPTVPPIPDIPVATAPPAQRDSDEGVPTILLVGAALVALTAAALVASWRLRRAVRIRRERAVDATWRVRGAWEEFCDLMRSRERADLRALTTAELAQRSEQYIGVEAAAAGARLAVIADRALFSPIPCTDDDADHAWREFLTAEAAIEPAVTGRDRARDVARVSATVGRWREVRRRPTGSKAPRTRVPSPREARPTPAMFFPVAETAPPTAEPARTAGPAAAAVPYDQDVDTTPAEPSEPTEPTDLPTWRPRRDDALEQIVDLRRIARNADRRIYAATHAGEREPVAVFLYSVGASNPDRHNRARTRAEEARRASTLHPNLLMIQQSGIVGDGSLFLVTDAIPEISLGSRLASSRFGSDVALAVAIGIECCEALAALHRGGIVHGDVHADNVWLSEDGHVRLGPVALRDPGARRATPFVAPEARDGRAPDPRADVYSVAILIGAVAAGRLPQVGESRSPERILGPLAEVRARRRALDSDPRRRPATATDLRDELWSFAAAEAGYPARP
ncbi:MAG: transglutaminase domain-containing protein [Actinomycetota bacterium]